MVPSAWHEQGEMSHHSHVEGPSPVLPFSRSMCNCASENHKRRLIAFVIVTQMVFKRLHCNCNSGCIVTAIAFAIVGSHGSRARGREEEQWQNPASSELLDANHSSSQTTICSSTHVSKPVEQLAEQVKSAIVAHSHEAGTLQAWPVSTVPSLSSQSAASSK